MYRDILGKNWVRKWVKRLTQRLNEKFACNLKWIENEIFERNDKASLLIGM